MIGLNWEEHIYTFMPETPAQKLIRYAPLASLITTEDVPLSLKQVTMQKCLEACEAWLIENADTPLGTTSAEYDAYNRRILVEGGKYTFSLYAGAITYGLQNAEFFRDVPHYIIKGWVICLKDMVAAWLKERG